jgi:hypothetical protein
LWCALLKTTAAEWVFPEEPTDGRKERRENKLRKFVFSCTRSRKVNKEGKQRR